MANGRVPISSVSVSIMASAFIFLTILIAPFWILSTSDIPYSILLSIAGMDHQSLIEGGLEFLRVSVDDDCYKF